jgi:hypothetical protein
MDARALNKDVSEQNAEDHIWSYERGNNSITGKIAL